jgi:tRNA (guanine37-N1)-methyltransferase
VRVDIVTIFPEAFTSVLEVGLLGKAINAGIFEVKVHDLRNWAPGPHRKVDEAPFGGGAGMVMTPGPVVEAVESIREPGGRVILLTAAGRQLNHSLARELSDEGQLVVVCGRYEGMDERISQVLDAEEISIGEFVLAGGEVAALVLIEAVGRFVPGMLGNASSLEEESFASALLEYPQYTRPAEFRGLKVPEVLLSGHHERVVRWRRQQALRRTYLRRPRLLEEAELSDDERALVESWQDKDEA